METIDILREFGCEINIEQYRTEILFPEVAFILIEEGYITIKGSTYGNLKTFTVKEFLSFSWNSYCEKDGKGIRMETLHEPKLNFALLFEDRKKRKDQIEMKKNVGSNPILNSYTGDTLQFSRIFGFIYKEIKRLNKDNFKQEKRVKY